MFKEERLDFKGFKLHDQTGHFYEVDLQTIRTFKVLPYTAHAELNHSTNVTLRDHRAVHDNRLFNRLIKLCLSPALHMD